MTQISSSNSRNNKTSRGSNSVRKKNELVKEGGRDAIAAGRVLAVMSPRHAWERRKGTS